MTDRNDDIAALRLRLHILLATPLDVTSPDSKSIEALVRLLTTVATYFNLVAVSDFGGRSGPARAPGIVEQVVAAAFQTYDGIDPHPTPFEKAAMLLRGITQGHPFTDGNKRTGFLVATYYLDLAGFGVPDAFDPDAVVDLCLRISAGEIRDVSTIAIKLRDLWDDSGAL